MKFGINFNNDDANKTILVALEELENTYFIENSNSESEKYSTDNDKNTFNNEIASINKSFENINVNKLDNFEFMENPNNYIDDKVYNDVKLKVEKVFESGKYSCHPNYFEKIGFERFLERRMEFKGLDRNIRDIVIKGQLMAFQKNEDTKKGAANNKKCI